MNRGKQMIETKKPFYKKWWVIAIAVFFVLSAISALSDEETEAVKEVKTVVPVEKKEEVKAVKTPDVVAADFIKKNFGTNKEEKKKAVVSTSFNNGIVEGVALEVTYWSPETAKKDFLNNAKDYMEKMKSLKEVTQATLVIQVPLTDQYGNTENDEVMRVMMNRETLDKINFENFSVDDLASIADDYYEHAALSE